MSDEFIDLKKRVEALESKFEGATFEEMVRDIIFFNDDVLTSTTRSASVVGGGGGTVVVPVNPTKYLKIYYKGQQYEIGIIAVT